MIWQVIPIDTNDLATDTKVIPIDTNTNTNDLATDTRVIPIDTNDGVHQKVWGKLNHTIRLSVLKHAVKLLNISKNYTKNDLPHSF